MADYQLRRPSVVLMVVSLGLVAVAGFATAGVAYHNYLTHPEGGVRYSHDLEPYAVEFFRSSQILLPGERVVAYYDHSGYLDGSRATIVTTSRLISHDRGQSTSLWLDEIESIHQLPVDDGEHVTVNGRGGRRITFLIFSEDDVDGFIDALAAERARSGT